MVFLKKSIFYHLFKGLFLIPYGERSGYKKAAFSHVYCRKRAKEFSPGRKRCSLSIRDSVDVFTEKKRAMLAFFRSAEYIIRYIMLWAISSAG